MNTNKIDVLAVVDAAIARNLERGAAKGSPSDKGLREARADVAEMIAELRALSAELRGRRVNHGRNPSFTLIAFADRIDAALARVGGAP